MAEAQVGKEVLAYCTKCKMDLNHVIVSMKAEKIAKVECRTCDKTRVYRAPKGITTPPAKKTRKKVSAAEAQSKSVEAEWTKLMDAAKENSIQKYTMKTSFGLGDKLSHPNFGDGIVGKLIYPNKIEVVFKTDIKVLIHGGAPKA